MNRNNLGVTPLHRNFIATVGFFILVFSAAALAQQDREPSVPLRAVWNQTAIPVGGQAVLGIVFDVPPKHHITDVEFGLFYVQIRDTLGLHFDSAIFPAGERFREGERCYRGRTVVRVPVTATDSAAIGDRAWKIQVGYQLCQEFGQEVCYLPVEREVNVTATIAARGTAVSPVNQDIFAPKVEMAEAKTLEERLIAALEQGSWLAFLLVFIGGFLTSFTPCVYPVIPITIGYIGGASRGRPLRGLGLSAIFVLGIALVYSSLGLVSAATGTLFGAVSGSPIVTLVVAAIFVLMGFSMLGVFDISLPASVQSRLQTGSKGPGLLGPLFVGMVSGLVMAPCVGPVIVALLAWVSSTGNLFYGWALLFVFSLGLGLLFLIIGTFAGAIQALPKAGAWMDVVKKGFGWILMAAALFICRFLIPEPFYSLGWAILLVMFAVFAGAFDPLTPDMRAGQRIWRGLTLIAFIVGAIMLFRVFMPQGGVGGITPTSGVEWIVNDEMTALNEAETQGKPMIVDVYADWCAACVELDHKTYTKPEVISRLEPFVRLKLDFTRENEWVREMKKKYQITGMPTVILYDASGNEVTRFTGFKTASGLIALLDRNKL